MNKKITMAAVVASASFIGNTTFADSFKDKPTPPNSNPPQKTATVTDKVTKEDIEKSQQEVATIDKEVTEQENVVSSSSKTVQSAEESVSTAEKNVKNTEQLASEATPENIQDAKDAVDDAKEGVTDQEQSVKDAEAEVTESASNVAKQEDVVKNAQSEVDTTAKQEMAGAKKSVDEAQAILLAEQEELKILEAELAKAEKAVAEEKAALQAAHRDVETATYYFESLKNASALHAQAQESLSLAKSKLAEATATLKAEKSKLDELKGKQAAVHADHKKLVDAYNAYMNAKAEAELQEKLAKQMAEIKGKGGVPVPIVSENGIVTEYMDGSTKSGKVTNKTVVAPLSISSTWTKKTLPHTGESSSILGILGVAIAGVLAGAFFIRKHKK